MPAASDRNEWSMVNIRNGYLVTEGCARCGARLTFFSREDAPPKDSYSEGKHIWKYRGSAQAVMFDLRDERTGAVISLEKVVGIMLCTGCKEECPVNRIAREEEKGDTWVYAALCGDTTHPGGRCVGDRELRALEEYFNQGIRRRDKRIRFAPCRLIENLDTCQGEIIADTGLTDLY